MRPMGRPPRLLLLALSWLVFLSAGAAVARKPGPVAGSGIACDTNTRLSHEDVIKMLGDFYKNYPCNNSRSPSGLHVCYSSGVPIPMTTTNTETNRTNERGFANRTSSVVPQGDKKLMLVAVPHRPAFEDFVSSAIYIFKTIMTKPIRPPHELCAFRGTYDELVNNVSEGVFDGAVGDVTITHDRARLVNFTGAYAPSGLALLVLADVDKGPAIQWIFLKPLTKELWITIVGFFFFTGFVVWVIEGPRNLQYQGSILRQFITAWYFIFSTLTFSHGQTLRSPLSKIAIVIWCFAVLVLVQSYTANLSSMLTTKRLLTDLDQLVRSQDYIGYQKGAFVRSMLMNAGVPWYRLRAYDNETEYAEALRKGSKNGGVSAIVDEVPYLSSFLSDSQRKKYFKMIDLRNRTLGFGFVFPKGCNNALIDALSIAIMEMKNGNQNSQFKEEWFDPAGMLTDSNRERLSVRRFSGLFVVTGCVSVLMLLISITRSIYAKYSGVRGSELQSADGDDGSVRPEEFSAPQIDTGNGSVPDQRIQDEVRDGDGHGCGGPSTGDEEAGRTMQDRMSDGSVPEFSVQIEMTTGQAGVGRCNTLNLLQL